MGYHIIADSCCDLPADLQQQWDVTVVPITLTLGDKEYMDDSALDVAAYIRDMNAYPGKPDSACPSPGRFEQAFLNADESFAVTLSNELSGANASAMLGKTLAEEDGKHYVHVFDSLSASAGEMLVVMKLKQLLSGGLAQSAVVQGMDTFIKNMKTFFVLDNLTNLVKSGRVSKIKSTLISVLNIKPIMGSDGHGRITLFSHARGERQIVERMAALVDKTDEQTMNESMVIAHCQNPGLAEKIKAAVEACHKFKDIFIVAMHGTSSMYANEKGIVLAF